MLSSICAHAQVEDYLQYTPTVARMAFSVSGVPSKYTMEDRLFVAISSIMTTYGAAGLLKYCVSERRPDGSDYKSFPSGHAAKVFRGANILRHEYGHISPWISVAGYSVAVATATLRVTGDHHYAHDVLAGAAIGMASTELSYALLPLWHKLTGRSKRRNPSAPTVVVMPSGSATDFALNGAVCF